jgi:hypothetical protein
MTVHDAGMGVHAGLEYASSHIVLSFPPPRLSREATTSLTQGASPKGLQPDNFSVKYTQADKC